MNKAMIGFIILCLVVAITACSSGVKTNNALTNNAQDSNVQASDVQNNNVPTNNVQNNDIPASDAQSITAIKTAENVNKTVTVQGKVVSTMQSATFHVSGYKIQDSSGTIDVSSTKQPAVNSTVTVTGILYQSRFFGIVINETG